MKVTLHRMIALQWTDVVLGLDLTGPVEQSGGRPLVSIEAVLPGAPISRLDGLPDYRPRAVLELRRGRGDICVLARQGKRVVAFAWISLGPKWTLRDAGLEFRLDPTEAVVYDFFTAAQYRGRGIMQYVIGSAADAARAQGRSRLYARAVRDNTGSIAAMEHMRFVRVASIKTLRVGGFTGFHVIDITTGETRFLEHARRHLRAMRPGLLRWRCCGRTGLRIYLPTPKGGH